MLLERDRSDQIKIRDVSDIIHLADVKKTPFTSTVSKGPGQTNTLVEWPVDKYPAPTTEGAVDEADTTTYEDLSEPQAILQGRLQIWERKPRVSRLANLTMRQAGVPNKQAFARSVARALVMIKRDMETTCLGDNESRLGTSTAGFRIRGLGKWIQNTAQTDLPVDVNYRTPTTSIYNGEINTVNDNVVVDILQSMYDQTGDSSMDLTGWCGSLIKRQFSGLVKYETVPDELTLARRFGNDGDTKTLTQAVDIIVTDFGRLTLRLSSFINTAGDPTTTASKMLCYMVPMESEMIRLRFALQPQFTEHPNLGGGPRGLMQAVGTLEVGNPLCLGKIAATPVTVTPPVTPP